MKTSSFNFSKFLTALAEKAGNTEGIIDARLEKARGDTKEPGQITEEQLAGDYRAKEEEETITEDLLEKVRTGSGDALVEGMLNTSKSKLVQHRNEDASAGDINKVEEQRLARKDRQEMEKQELANETGKKSRLLDNNTSKSDGLKLAGWQWGFTRTAGMVDRTSPDSYFYCKGCGQTYDEQAPKCERCGDSNIARIPGKYMPKPKLDANPALDTGKPMPKIQSAKGRVVTARWSFETQDPRDPFNVLDQAREDEGETDFAPRRPSRMVEDEGDVLPGDDPSLTEGALGELKDPAFNLLEDDTDVDFSADEEKVDLFAETVSGRTKATGTRMDIMEVACLDMGKYENEFGQLDHSMEKQLVADIMAYLVEEHPEMRKKITPKMLNLTKIRDGKVFYLKPV